MADPFNLPCRKTSVLSRKIKNACKKAGNGPVTNSKEKVETLWSRQVNIFYIELNS